MIRSRRVHSISSSADVEALVSPGSQTLQTIFWTVVVLLLIMRKEACAPFCDDRVKKTDIHSHGLYLSILSRKCESGQYDTPKKMCACDCVSECVWAHIHVHRYLCTKCPWQLVLYPPSLVAQRSRRHGIPIPENDSCFD